jgi:hypothetical protein
LEQSVLGHSLIYTIGILRRDNVRLISPERASLAALSAFHAKDYLEVLKEADDVKSRRSIWSEEVKRVWDQYGLAEDGDCSPFRGYEFEKYTWNHLMRTYLSDIRNTDDDDDDKQNVELCASSVWRIYRSSISTPSLQRTISHRHPLERRETSCISVCKIEKRMTSSNFSIALKSSISRIIQLIV